ncbi:hypothetical protein V1517DRAFT_331040 [Lipomyces orientalis]|uniref:Uncharacterized protein n=1 Tax=Lipomyces orientalis TaxID=1233043 RepID=A0ACC3TFX5_9ASCO
MEITLERLFCIFGGATFVWAIYVCAYCSDIELSLPLSSDSSSSHTTSPVQNASQRLGGTFSAKRAVDKSSLYYKMSRDIQLVSRFTLSGSTGFKSGVPYGRHNRGHASLLAVGVYEATKSLIHDILTMLWNPVRSNISATGDSCLPVHCSKAESSFDQRVANPIVAVMFFAIRLPFRCLKLVFVRSAKNFCEFLEMFDAEYTIIPTHQLTKYPGATRQFRRLDGSRTAQGPRNATRPTFKYTARYLPVEPYHRASSRDAVCASVQSGFAANALKKSVYTLSGKNGNELSEGTVVM